MTVARPGIHKTMSSTSTNGTPKDSDSWVHDVHNFAWGHQLVNIHKAMMVDVLHQLMKGMVMHLISWIKLLLKDKIPAARIRKGTSRSIHEASRLNKLDERFRVVPPFRDLRTFPTSPR